jgi:ribosomal-protein-alanine N-acetyltransferase
MAKMMLTIRAATFYDLPDIAAIERESFNPPWSEDSLKSAMTGEHSAVLVADESGWIVGFAVASIAEPEAELLQIAVSSASRARGIATEMLEWTIEKLRRRGAMNIFLEVRESNAAAIALYDKLGFARIGLRRGYYEKPVEDAIIMRLTVKNKN